MRSFFHWVNNNGSLSFLLGVEAFCLLFFLGWLVTVLLEDDKTLMDNTPVAVTVITEDAHLDYVRTELEVFSLNNKSDYKVITTSRENAIAEFAENEHAVLILSRSLDDQELASLKIKADRLPIEQDVIDHSFASERTPLIFVGDNQRSDEESKLSDFLRDNKAQDLVLQKYQKKTVKPLVKNG